MNIQIQMYNVKQFHQQALLLSSSKACCICLRQINMNYFIDNIHLRDIVYCKVDELFMSYCITEQMLKERFIRVNSYKFVIIEDWYVIV